MGFESAARMRRLGLVLITVRTKRGLRSGWNAYGESLSVFRVGSVGDGIGAVAIEVMS